MFINFVPARDEKILDFRGKQNLENPRGSQNSEETKFCFGKSGISPGFSRTIFLFQEMFGCFWFFGFQIVFTGRFS
jgi:hypothetical protein